MKKRLRKKLRKGEFRELGFELRLGIDASLDDAAQLKVFDDFLIEAIEAHDLAFGGGGLDGNWDGFVTRSRRGSATIEDQEHVRKWLEDHPSVHKYEIGKLVDAWYP